MKLSLSQAILRWGYSGPHIDEVYIDEVQDFTQVSKQRRVASETAA